MRSINEIRHEVKQSQSVLCNELFTKLPASLQRSMEVATWLSMLPIQEHGFALHKGAFTDAFCLRYGWQPNLLPSTCVRGKTFSVEHALNCPCGGYPSIRQMSYGSSLQHCLLKFATVLEPSLVYNPYLVSFSSTRQKMMRMMLV